MFKFRFIKLLLGIGALALMGALGLFLGGTPQVGAQPGAGPQGPMPVSAMTVKPEPVRIWKDFPGRLEAVESADIRPQVSGLITELSFEDGQYVKAGDVLFVIDPRPFEAEVMQAKANLRVAQSEYSLADKEFKRAKELIETKAVSQRTYDERRSRLNLVLAQIQAAKAALERSEIDLDYAFVKAPISGRVSRAEITVGNLVEAGLQAPVVTTIVADEQIYVDFEVDEQTYLSHVRAQARSKEEETQIPVEVILRGDDNTIFQGVIHAFDNRINTASGTIRARAILENENGALLPGMFAKVRLGSAAKGEQILVDEKAFGTDQDRKFVYVIDENSAASYREVRIGDRIGQKRVVLSGLQEGDMVINAGLIKIRPGIPVKPMLAGESPEEDIGAPPVETPADAVSPENDTP